MNEKLTWSVRISCVAALVLGGVTIPAFADEREVRAEREVRGDVEIRIVNLTRGQVFSPVIAWSHSRGFAPFFSFGEPASEEVRAVAEDGDTGPLADLLEGDGNVREVVIGDGPIPPGGEAILTVEARGRNSFISLASMLVNTNDTFFALRGVQIPRKGRSTAFFQPGWDAGTEDNNEDCSYIPGPACADIDAGNLSDPDDGEGFVFTQEGIHGQSGGVATSDLDPSQQDWRNPVAYVVVTRNR